MGRYTYADAEQLRKDINAHGGNFPQTKEIDTALFSWLTAENGLYNNPLGVTYDSSPAPGYQGAFFHYNNVGEGLNGAAANLLAGAKQHTSGYDGIVARGNAGDAFGLLTALAVSSWDAGHYGLNTSAQHPTGSNKLIGIYNTLLKDTGAIPINSLPAIPDIGGAIGGAIGGVGSGLPNLDVGGAINSVGLQIQDTFTWIAFIFVGIAILVIGGFLLKNSGMGANA